MLLFASLGWALALCYAVVYDRTKAELRFHTQGHEYCLYKWGECIRGMTKYMGRLDSNKVD